MDKEVKLYNLDIWIYNRVKFFSDKDMQCFESNQSMAELFNRHPNRVSSSIKKLLDNNYLENVGKSKFDRRLILGKKQVNISGDKLNNLGDSINNLGVEELARMLKGINKNGVKNLTKAVIGINKNGDIYKDIIKYVILDIKEDTKKEIVKKKVNGERFNFDKHVLPNQDLWVSEAKRIQPSFQDDHIKTQMESFQDYWTSVSGAKGVKLDWLATWRNWIRNARPQFKKNNYNNDNRAKSACEIDWANI